MLVKNGTMIATIWAESTPFWATSSNTALLHLDQGQQVIKIKVTFKERRL